MRVWKTENLFGFGFMM